MLLRGFRFGMLLQLAIGPMCIFIFQTSIAHGFWAGEMGVLGTAMVDSLEILLAIVGVGALLGRSRRAERVLKVFGATILFLYGTVSICGAFGLTLLPRISLPAFDAGGNTLLQAVVLSLSDPLTIVFWAGIFSAKVAEEKLKKASLRLFGCGCVLATLSFLTLVSLVGSLTKQIIPDWVGSCLNFAVGLLLFYFAYKDLRAKPRAVQVNEEENISP